MVVITISGLPGSGTTTVSKILANRLKLRHVDAGKVFRKLADDYDLKLPEFGRYVAEHPEIDKELDSKQLEIAREGQVIIEGRLAGWALYQAEISASKIWLKAPLETRTERVMHREKKPQEIIMAEIQERERCERKRYISIYKFDIEDLSVYDLVIDTANMNQTQVSDKIISYLNKH